MTLSESAPIPRPPRLDGYDSSSSTDSATTSHHSRPRTFIAPAVSQPTDYLFPPPLRSGQSSVSSSGSSTPIPSRSTSPLPQFITSNPSASSCTSDTDSEPGSPLLRNADRSHWWREDTRRGWWSIGVRRRRPRDGRIIRIIKKWSRRLIRHPFFPRQPITIILTLVLLTIFATSLTYLIIYILNPDKEPLPWRAYCSAPLPTTLPASSTSPFSESFAGTSPAPFPPENLDDLPPVGLYIGVFSMDSSFERRMLVRTTWASHPRSRNGAGDGDGGAGTSRSVVRFILGQPRKDWERRVRLEMQMYNDIVVLPVAENMNGGKSHTYFSWASINAWVPPVYMNSTAPAPQFSYSNYTASPPPLAPHDPIYAWNSPTEPWVRPDYVIKLDDDSFVMLAELEARLRLELHVKQSGPPDHDLYTFLHSPAAGSNVSTAAAPPPVLQPRSPPWTNASPDPLVYWGYLVTNRWHRFMAGELYALSWSLTDWVAKDPTVKTLTKGAEDKQTAKWMTLHPRASEVRWASERCWIYNHPRSGTVYTHGFLFPSEVTRVKKEILSYFEKSPPDVESPPAPSADVPYVPTPAAWAHSSVSTFGVRYTAPVQGLTPVQGVEALVEGSEMSMLREGSTMTPQQAWLRREGRRTRYEGHRVGGTVVVHFIKKNMWYLETALALLDGEELSESEKQKENALSQVPFKHRRW